MIGPLLSQELLVGSRRGKHELLRRSYAAWLIAQFWVMLGATLLSATVRHRGAHQELLEAINGYVEILIVQHFALIVLVTPAFVAGAIADEKARGNLQLLLAAGLTSWEIVTGKLLGRLVQVALIALTPLPLFVLVSGFGEVYPRTLFTLAVVSLAPLLALGALSLLASVWSTQTREAVVRTYLWIALGLTFAGLFRAFILTPNRLRQPAWLGAGLTWLGWADKGLDCLNPATVVEAAWDGSTGLDLGPRLLLHVAGWCGLGVVCLVLSAWRLRPAYRKQLESAGQPRQRRAVDRPPVTDEPLVWKEQEVEGITPLRGLRGLPRWSGVFLLTAVSCVASSFWFGTENPIETVLCQGALVLVVVSLIVGVRSSGAVCGERERHTWDLLLLTPLTSRALVRDKHRGIFNAAVPCLIAYVLPALGASLMISVSAVSCVLLLAGCVGLATYFMAGVGLGCSVRSQSSWRSLLATLAVGYAYGVALLVAPTVLGASCLMVGSAHENPALLFFTIADVGLAVWLVRPATQALLDLASARVMAEDRRGGPGRRDVVEEEGTGLP